MTPKQTEHLNRILEALNTRLTSKYKKGAEEHGGNSVEMDTEKLLDEILDEIIDLFTYVETLRERIALIKKVNLPQE